MTLSIVDVILILIIASGALIGYKNGAIKEGTQFIGLLIILIVSFTLKDKLMVMLYENLPFFNLFGPISGIDAINVLLYQLVAFIFIFALLYFVLRVLLVITGLVELLLKLTVFFSVSSKLLGIFVGILEFYVYVFIALYIFNMPVFNLTYVNDSSLANTILKDTPVLSNLVDGTIDVYYDVYEIVKNKDEKDSKEVNSLVLATLLDNKLITIESAKKLVESNKIIIEDDSILDDYQDDGRFYQKIKESYN